MKKLILSLMLLWSLPALAGMNVISGNVSHRQALFATQGGALPLQIELSYNSHERKDGVLGAGWSHSYDIYLHQNSDGTMVLAGGKDRRYYTASGSIYTARTGDFSTLVRNADFTWTLTLRNGLQYRFGTDRKLTAIVDRYGNTVTVNNSVSGQTSITDPSGRSTVIHYNGSKIDWIKDPALKQYDFTYNATTGLLETVTYPAPDPTQPTVRPRWEYKYTAKGSYIEYIKDPEGHITKYGYTYGKVTRMVDPEGVLDMNGSESADVAAHTKTIQYLDSSQKTNLTEKDGGLWVYAYDNTKGGMLTAKTAPDGSGTGRTFYPSGHVWFGLLQEEARIVESVPSGTHYLQTVYVTEYTGYDSYGNPTEIKGHVRHRETYSDGSLYSSSDDPVDKHLTYTYGNYDRVTSATDLIAGTTVTLGYTTRKSTGEETVTVTAPKINAGDTSGPKTVLVYRADGQLKQVTDPLGRVTTYAYTAAGLPQTVTDVTSGISSTFSNFDAMGRPGTVTVSKSGQPNRVTNLFYDALGRPTDVSLPGVTLSDGGSPVTLLTSFGYDLAGNRTSVTDAENKTTGFAYNYRGDVTKITDAMLHDTVLEYGGASCGNCGGGVDKLTAVIDANQVGQATPLKTKFHYDQSGNLEREEDPLGKALLYTWYPNGRLKQKIDAQSGQVLLAYTYEPDGKIKTKTVRDANGVDQLTSFGYDAAGHLQTAASPNIAYTFIYYANGWVKTVSDGTRTTEYLYDAAGRRELVTVKQGTTTLATLDYVYDPVSKQLTQIVSAAGTFTFGYDAWGRRATLTYPNGVVTAYSYNSQTDWLTGVDYQNLGLTVSYPEHDTVGNRKQRVESGTAATYAYDATYQLTQAKTGPAEENFTYDPVGNRESGPTVKDTAAAAYAHDAANRMLEGRKSDYAYDDRGNQRFRYLDDAHTKYWEFKWDGENQLAEAKLVDGGATVRTVTFKYDPFGRRIEKRVTEGAAITIRSYFYDGEDIVLETASDGTTTTSTHYVHGPGIDEPLALVRGGQNYFYHADGLGSVVAISNSARSIVQRYTYESFGMLTASNPAFENPYTYTGREWDEEIGLYYYRARYYDPMEGRFVSKDPIGFAGGGVNLFSYVGNSPTGWVDPWGYFQWHGNWGGPDWTAGQNKSWNDFSPAEKSRIRVAIDEGLDRKIIPLDAQDALYMSHDIAYGDCRDKCANATCPAECEQNCFNGADFTLAGGLSQLGLQKPYWLKVWITTPVFYVQPGYRGRGFDKDGNYYQFKWRY